MSNKYTIRIDKYNNSDKRDKWKKAIYSFLV